MNNENPDRDEINVSIADNASNDFSLRRAGYILVAAFIFLFGIWAILAPIESAALAPGVVQVEGKRKSVQHLEGGIVSQIITSSGAKVEEGDPLIILDATRDRAEREIITGRLYNTQAKVERLQAERDDRTSLVFSDALLDLAERDARAENAITSEGALFSVRQADRLGEEDVLKGQQRGLEALAQSTRAIIGSLQQEIRDLSELLEEGYVDKQRLRELERQASRYIGELTDLTVSVDETRLKILQLRKRFKTQVVDELTEEQEQLYDLQQQLMATNDRVQRATIRAPVSGIVMDLRPNTVGGVISSGDTLLEIVPQMNELIVEAQVSPMDIDRVSVGQPAEVRFSVYKDAYLISGTLVKLSADRLLDGQDEYPYYAAEIKLQAEDLYLLKGLAIIPGMPAEVLIKTGERSMLSYLTSPMRRLFSRSFIED